MIRFRRWLKKNTKTVKEDKAFKTVYCLYRVSTKGQVDKDDIPMQRQACREFAERQNGWVIKKEFMEKGVSGFKVSAENRDAIQELKAAAERKPKWAGLITTTINLSVGLMSSIRLHSKERE